MYFAITTTVSSLSKHVSQPNVSHLFTLSCVDILDFIECQVYDKIFSLNRVKLFPEKHHEEDSRLCILPPSEW